MTRIVKGKTANWEIVIGLEVHAQINTKSKLFSRSSTEFGVGQNKNVSFFDIAAPGQLPVINEFAVRQAIKTGLGLNAQINLNSRFDRKNYFYADLPQGYQITQLYSPIVGEGWLDIDLEDGEKKRIGIERLHMEQDAGKLIHDQHPTKSFVDLNRSGVALMEIVSKPDVRGSEEAVLYVKKLRSIVRALGTCNGDMEKGNMRCDANVSMRKVGETELGTRCEIKNLNSMKNIALAIEYEAQRQVDILEEGGKIDQETRLFDALTGETKTMRSKEDAIDYRYFPEPDLPPLHVSEDVFREIKQEMPELPHEKKERYMNELGLSEYDASVLTSDSYFSEYFEELIKKHDAKLSVNWMTVELFGRLNKTNILLEESIVTADKLSKLLDLIVSNVISGKIAKDVLDIMLETGDDAEKIVEEKGLKQVTDTVAIEKIIDEIIAANGDKVEQYRSGKDKLFGFFVGQAMKATQGKANPQVVNEILKKKLD